MSVYDFAMFNYRRCMNAYHRAETETARLYWLHKAAEYRAIAHNALLG